LLTLSKNLNIRKFMFLKRFISAVVSLALFIPVIVYLGKYAVIGFSILLMLFCAYEVYSLYFDKYKEFKIVLTIISVLIFLVRIFYVSSELSLISIAVFFISLYFLLRARKFESIFYTNNKTSISKYFIYFVISFFIIIYFSIFISYIPLIRSLEYGNHLIFLHIFMVWSGDTGAFLVGSKFGNTKLYKIISPGKSVEGAIGGLVFSFVFVLIYKLIFIPSLSILDCVNIGVIIGLIAQLGDLFESFIKRSANVKDSGSFLPGHGGVFDRFDGVIFSAPFFYYYIKLFF